MRRNMRKILCGLAVLVLIAVASIGAGWTWDESTLTQLWSDESSI